MGFNSGFKGLRFKSSAMLHRFDWLTVTDVVNDVKSSKIGIKKFILAALSPLSAIVTLHTTCFRIQNFFLFFLSFFFSLSLFLAVALRPNAGHGLLIL